MTELKKKSSSPRELGEAISGLFGHLHKTELTYERRLSRYEKEVQELKELIRYLESRNEQLKRRMEDAPREFRNLENKLREANEQLVRAYHQNEKLVTALYEAREQIQALKEEVDKLCAPPSGFGVFLGHNEDGTVDILTAGRKMRVNVHSDINVEELTKGQELILNEGLNVVQVRGFEVQGEVVKLKDVLGDGRAIITYRADEERVAELAAPLRNTRLNIGDHLLFDPRSGYLLEKLPKAEIEDLILEEVPEIDYSDVGGLDAQIEAMRDAIELPYLYAEYFREHKLTAPKGVLLYGPPGCGKTLIAKAVANNLARKMREKTGKDTKSYFLNVKGPELLNKYVGETERKIREVFQKAKEKAKEDVPVVIFFDEMDALFRTRGSGISSDVESTIVPQFLSEIDGVESLKNVIVIGASNRQDLIDPAILRPGRLDVKIKIDRPDKKGAVDIFSKYLTADLPIHESELKACGGNVQAVVQGLIEKTVEEMYGVGDNNKFLEVTYANGEVEIFYFKDFASGAMIENIVSRAKKFALKRLISTGEKGIMLVDLIQAVREEFQENEDLPNTTNPDDWTKISGRKGEKVIYVKTLLKEAKEKLRSTETIATGQYL
ncbi:proteasome-associated ATPase [Candidatus Hakubella thermalkaliphila]|uniref:AAA ATPase forming ring-shaped complexes n=2 Tax=Candidatus Hakubella thermalkaliphila TaxID=2754717 RepID=A0A6V8PX67_9ACTN|nr:proteasome ATPase [Candidatus Hakubella thermalkaliphila]GFP30949.1 proteasome-associated ATPase [Candidatus Hakubella thermalkaliphila]GFP36733.1 proteasome-associated ATPase [Candidatus Hakubella thermalkaliphila]GFP39614.1 proteasome-associated ATPase [Candidatus Hakubella thermalkaliphila]GFP42684.1 proteasome-associated ATPase [Candidatus Hakubella thermalkaliphila]